MLRKTKNLRSVTSYIDITPIVDTVFNLMIFFALSLNFIRTSVVKVELPRAKTGEKGEETFTLFITKDGEIKDGEGKTINNLEQFFKKNEIKSLVINADVESKHGEVVKVIDYARRSGTTRISVGVIQR